MKKKYLVIIYDNAKTLIGALLIAILIRSFLFQPFYIPSSSMEPTLLVGDRLFVSKYSYGYSRHSVPFSPNIYKKRIFEQTPSRGDVIVFKTPSDNRTDYIKRLIGLPGDTIQFISGDLYINEVQIFRDIKSRNDKIYCGNKTIDVNTFEEKFDNNVKFKTVYNKEFTFQNSDKFLVPDKHYFFLGDNRDCSKDSRFLASVGYVHENNLVGKAQLIFFSSNLREGRLYQFWKWFEIIRFDRFFKKIK